MTHKPRNDSDDSCFENEPNFHSEIFVVIMIDTFYDDESQVFVKNNLSK